MPDPRFILAIDTALYSCGVAILDSSDGSVVSQLEPMKKGQAERLVPLIGECLEMSGNSYKDIDLIVTTIGPGAFTGVRIGLATARSLSVALSIDVCGVNTFDVINRAYREKAQNKSVNNIGVILETKRKDFYFRMYGADNEEIISMGCYTDQQIEKFIEGSPCVLIGDGIDRFIEVQKNHKAEIDVNFIYPDPSCLARHGLELYQKGAADKAEPLYLRGADVSLPKRKIRQIED
jgi:tRNA threonylcarbamoyladenosine biosynthesis protein TsaB